MFKCYARSGDYYIDLKVKFVEIKSRIANKFQIKKLLMLVL